MKVNLLKLKYYAVFFPLFILMAFSHNNNDYKAYSDFYSQVGKVEINSIDLELFYLYLMKTSKFFFNDYNSFLFLISLIIYILISKYFYVNSENRGLLLGIVLFFIHPIFFSIVQIRFLLATALLLTGVSKLINGKKKWAFILFIMASGIHRMFFIFLPFYMIKNFKKIYFQVIFLIAISSSLLFLRLNFIDFKDLIVILEAKELNQLLKKVVYYFLYEKEKMGGFLLALIPFFTSYMIGFSKSFKSLFEGEEENIDLFIKLNLYIAIGYSLIVMNRIGLRYFRVMLLLNIPFYVKALSKKKNHLAFLWILIIYILHIFFIIKTSNYAEVVRSLFL
jgi:EpsG-like putative glucosyltransferase